MIHNPQEFGLNQQLAEKKPSLIPILLFQLILSTKVIVSYNVYVLNAILKILQSQTNICDTSKFCNIFPFVAITSPTTFQIVTRLGINF